jgi:hypothetical protein
MNPKIHVVYDFSKRCGSKAAINYIAAFFGADFMYAFKSGVF